MLTGDLIPGAYASGAQIKSNRQSVDIECRGLYIGEPCSPGMLLGVAYPVAETQGFPAHITFDSQFRTS